MRNLWLGAVPALLLMGGTAAAEVPSWRVSEASGNVRVVTNGRSQPATRGALLSSGSTIATGAQARAVIVRGEEFVVVSPNSQLRIPEGESRGGLIQMLTDFGTALFRIERRATPHFGVQTPYLAAVVKGTTFTVTVGQSGASVQVTEGAVEVSTVDGGAAETITPGMIASVGASDLYRLTVDGDAGQTVRTSQAPGTTVSAAVRPTVSYSGPAARPVAITQAIGEEPVSLRDVTGGLLDAGAGFETVFADASDHARRESARENRKDEGGQGDADKGDSKDGKDKSDGKDKGTDKGGKDNGDGKDGGKDKDDGGKRGGGDDDRGGGKNEGKDDGKGNDKDGRGDDGGKGEGRGGD